MATIYRFYSEKGRAAQKNISQNVKIPYFVIISPANTEGARENNPRQPHVLGLNDVDCLYFLFFLTFGGV
ncbi:hypothetical protein [Fibrobacter sp. UWP2]|uniref:hypothetical protein n=1 Tax=Fibrobacter sp. UWP2 TaxID=1896216 RepID=UPI001160261D|nr:hypothetical protein [Fibrobacter sp. UWP2]